MISVFDIYDECSRRENSNNSSATDMNDSLSIKKKREYFGQLII